MQELLLGSAFGILLMMAIFPDLALQARCAIRVACRKIHKILQFCGRPRCEILVLLVLDVLAMAIWHKTFPGWP